MVRRSLAVVLGFTLLPVVAADARAQSPSAAQALVDVSAFDTKVRP